MNTQRQHKCSVCDREIDINNLHPDSLKPQGEYREDWSVIHRGCQNLPAQEREGTQPGELQQAWVTHR